MNYHQQSLYLGISLHPNRPTMSLERMSARDAGFRLVCWVWALIAQLDR